MDGFDKESENLKLEFREHYEETIREFVRRFWALPSRYEPMSRERTIIEDQYGFLSEKDYNEMLLSCGVPKPGVMGLLRKRIKDNFPSGYEMLGAEKIRDIIQKTLGRRIPFETWVHNRLECKMVTIQVPAKYENLVRMYILSLERKTKTPLEDIFESRISHAVKMYGIDTLEDLSLLNLRQISKIPGIGGKSVLSIERALKQKGLWK